MEIRKTTQMKTEIIYSPLAIANHHHLCLAKTQRQAGDWENFIMKKRQGFRNTLIISWWHREAASRLTRSGAFLWFAEHIWLSLIDLELGAEAKNWGSW